MKGEYDNKSQQTDILIKNTQIIKKNRYFKKLYNGEVLYLEWNIH